MISLSPDFGWVGFAKNIDNWNVFYCNFTCRPYLVFAIFIGDLASKDKTMKETRRIHDVNLSIKSTLTFITK